MFVLVTYLATCIRHVVFLKQKTAYELRISDWSSDVCSSDLRQFIGQRVGPRFRDRVPDLGGADLAAPVAAGGGNHHLGISALRVREAARRLFNRLVDHAAKAQSRCGRAGAWPCRADHWLTDVADGDDEGAAARLFPRSEQHTTELQSLIR